MRNLKACVLLTMAFLLVFASLAQAQKVYPIEAEAIKKIKAITKDYVGELGSFDLEALMEPENIANKQRREEFASSVPKILSILNHARAKMLKVLSELDVQILLSFHMTPPQLIEHTRSIDRCERWIEGCFSIQKETVFKIHEICDFFDSKDGAYELVEGKILFTYDSDLADFRAHIIELQDLASQELTLRLEAEKMYISQLEQRSK